MARKRANNYHVFFDNVYKARFDSNYEKINR